MSDLLATVEWRLHRLREEHPHSTDQAWATLLLDVIRRFADEGPDERLQVSALAGMATQPKLVTEDGRLRGVRTEQILVTPRAQARKRASRVAGA